MHDMTAGLASIREHSPCPFVGSAGLNNAEWPFCHATRTALDEEARSAKCVLLAPHFFP